MNGSSNHPRESQGMDHQLELTQHTNNLNGSKVINPRTPGLPAQSPSELDNNIGDGQTSAVPQDRKVVSSSGIQTQGTPSKFDRSSYSPMNSHNHGPMNRPHNPSDPLPTNTTTHHQGLSHPETVPQTTGVPPPKVSGPPNIPPKRAAHQREPSISATQHGSQDSLYAGESDVTKSAPAGSQVDGDVNPHPTGSHRLRRSTTFFTDNDVESQEEMEQAWGVVGQNLINHLPKIPRDPITNKIKLKDAVNYVIKVNRVRNGVATILKAPGLCPTCKSLELTTEKFLVRDRAQSLKETRFFGALPRQKRSIGEFEIGSGSGRCRIGTLKSIWKKSVFCNFCRLVIHSVREQPDTDWLSIDSVPDKKIISRRPVELNAICYASWQIDGRELTRDSTGAVLSSKACTRRIRLHWSSSCDFKESFLVLVGGPLVLASSLFLGRRIEPGRANPKLMKNWIDTCHQCHGNRCNDEPDARFNLMVRQAYFGVIDVQNMCLTKLPPGERYAALSYTWGGAEPFKTEMSNVRKSQAKFGIDKIWTSLPRTIKDAINLTRELSVKYLWVDSICIVQDSLKSWELNANVMDLVYGNAHFTICAADGDNPNVGLRGMDSSQRSFSQHMEEYAPGVRLMVSYLAEAYIHNSTWNTRAWTFQERILSRRCIIFTDTRVFFQCRSTTLREDVTSEEKLGWSIDHAHVPLELLDDLESRAIHVYMKSVELYTSRNLSRPENILSAFQGIGNLVGKKLGPPLIYGLPKSHFDWALLWEPQCAANLRIHSVSKTQDFPSWSWCGWIGTEPDVAVMEYKKSLTSGTTINLQEWLMEHTWITWFIRDGHGSLKLVWDNRKISSERQKVSRWGGYVTAPDATEETADPYGRPLKWPGLNLTRYTFEKTIPEYPFGVNISDPSNEPDIQFPDQRFLQFWTWSAHFRLTDHSSSSSRGSGPGHNLGRYGISDYKGDWCGTIVLDQRWVKMFGSNPGTEYEFIAISEAKEFAEDEYNSWMYYISKDREQSEWDLYYVLLIEIRNEIAYRVGLGKVYQEAFENSCREEKKWKEFIMG